KALAEGDFEQLDLVDKNDHRINAHEVGIDGTCALIIARRQPTAVDLRMLMGISKIVTDLERCGDKAALIARKAKVIFNQGVVRIPCIADISESGVLAVGLIRTALNAFARQDAVAAAAIVREDLEIDHKFQSITRQLITYMMEDPRLISLSFEIMFIAKAIERIGDHAKNIAEQIIYITRGTDVRHLAYDQLEREAKGVGTGE
ncbi:MAG: phosphate signaling complex protein PhoU, partial [Proteobacteria bacterium]|nr:phosphate signaling complex protein PhoU [Pseudomonadota bacterium]